jgi:AraC-like DNA-binding protein
MNYSREMESRLQEFLERLEQDNTSCIIPLRKGLRKRIKHHIFHNHTEVFLQVSGVTVFSFPREEIRLTEGQMLVVPSELPHAEKIEKIGDAFQTVVITPAFDYLQCHLSGDSGLGVPTIKYFETIDSIDNIKIRQYVDLLIESGNPSDQYSHTVSRGLLFSLLATVLGLLANSPQGSEEYGKVQEAKNIILSQYRHSSLTVKQLAGLLNCSADYLSWLFHRDTGVTLNKYIKQLRLERADDLLKNTDYTISEIAWICGFRNPAYFSRVFSEHYNIPPRDYRKV